MQILENNWGRCRMTAMGAIKLAGLVSLRGSEVDRQLCFTPDHTQHHAVTTLL